MEIIYHDNHLLVVNKVAGIASQGSSQNNSQDGVEEQCRLWLQHQKQRSTLPFLHVVQRLDKPVSGLLLMACSSKALRRLQAYQREGRLTKWYLAIVEGAVIDDQGSLEHLLWHDERHRRAVVVASGSAFSAKRASLHYRVLQRSAQMDCSLLAIRLETGRYHQIRAQLSEEGHPIWGDHKYGSELSLGGGQAIALHHFQTELFHPIGAARLTLRAALPHYWPEQMSVSELPFQH